jgi:hypothetical protein
MGMLGKTNQRQRVTFREKVSTLEVQLNNLATHLAEVRNALEGLTLTSNALATLSGLDKVQAQVDASRLEKATSDNSIMLSALDEAFKTGRLAEQLVASPESFVIGVEYDNDGTEMDPGRCALVLGRLPEAMRAPFIGAAPGQELTLASGNTFNVERVLRSAAE